MKNQIKKMFATALLLIAVMFNQSGFAQMKPMDGSKMVMSKYSFTETVEMLKGAIEQQNLMVVYELDGQKMLKMAGKNVGGMKQLLFFHPAYMAKISEANQMAGIAVPLKILVMEKDGKVMVRYFMPSKVLAPYKGTEAIAKDLDTKVTKIIAEATK
ncbi:DUF302 domain-containing protein [Flavobacterium chilense]|uniref:Uncharacterized conserved protein, DUF302 family n=1 Tax=Flavobacterium chilense TaxID=946677 RepID=A0A1M7MDQ3_9FLAO|nr:DUF302 domain-containing protein [Flavobacterium chilense]SHM88950.1 Uncharacterized conserved protein, DUF302 family [Flavobacterium chilense]